MSANRRRREGREGDVHSVDVAGGDRRRHRRERENGLSSPRLSSRCNGVGDNLSVCATLSKSATVVSISSREGSRRRGRRKGKQRRRGEAKERRETHPFPVLPELQ